MKIIEIGTGYTSIPARMGAATEIVVEELTKSYMKQKKDVLLVDIASDDRLPNNLPIVEVKVPKKFRKTDVQLGIMHKLKRVIYSICLTKTLKKILKDNKEKCILHFHNQYNLFFFLKLTSKKIRNNAEILYTNHSYIWHDEWSKIEGIIRKKYFQEVYCMKKADKIFVLNEHTKDNIINHIGINKNKVFLIDNGVNTDTYSPLSKNEIIKYKENNNLKNKKVFIQVGSVCDRKNQYESLKLLLPSMKKNEDIIFCYVGGIIDPEYKEKIDSLAEKEKVSDRVIYYGELKPGVELNKFYNMAEAMIFPSKAEGFSLVIIEAMSSGIPVIIKDELEFKLSNECLKFNNIKSFNKILTDTILNEKQHSKLSKNVRNIVLKNYSWDSIAEEYIKN